MNGFDSFMFEPQKGDKLYGYNKKVAPTFKNRILKPCSLSAFTAHCLVLTLQPDPRLQLQF